MYIISNYQQNKSHQNKQPNCKMQMQISSCLHSKILCFSNNKINCKTSKVGSKTIHKTVSLYSVTVRTDLLGRNGNRIELGPAPCPRIPKLNYYFSSSELGSCRLVIIFLWFH